MMNREWLEKTEAYVKQEFDAGKYFAAHPDARAYRLEHTYRVANIAKQIAQREGFNQTEAVIAGLLHNVSYCEEFDANGWKEHGRRAAKMARPFLEELGLAQERVNDICYGIAIHVDDEADYAGEKTPFALTVGDADNIDRFDAYRIHETLHHEGFLEKALWEKQEIVEKRLGRLRELSGMPLGTKTAEEIWQERLSFYTAFYEKLLAQLRSSSVIAQ